MKQETKTKINQWLEDTIKEAKFLKIPISSNISPEVIINSRAKKRLGACVQSKEKFKKIFSIQLSKMVLEWDEKDIKSILAHEIIHTCPNCMNHGKIWKKHCKLMEENYGYRITRVINNQLALDENKRVARYEITCNNCGNKSRRYRKSSIIQKPNLYKCKCGGSLSVSTLERS